MYISKFSNLKNTIKFYTLQSVGKNLKFKKNTCIWAQNILLKNGQALLLLQQASKGMHGPLWPSTPLSWSSMAVHTHFGGRQLVLKPFLGVNRSWRLYMGCQLLLTPFVLGVNCDPCLFGAWMRQLRGVSLARPKK